jgi:hypothetical protein
MSSSSFTEKIITVNITLSSGTFDGTNSNTVSLTGLRVDCKIEKGGHPSKNKAKIKVFGMTESQMNQLTALAFKPLAVRKNLIQVLAGDANGMSVAFAGSITGAWANYHSPPNLYFSIEALTGYYPAIAPAAPMSVKGGSSVADMMATLAQQMGYTFRNEGVTTQLSNPYLSGTAYQQAEALADAADCEFIVDDGELVIAPRGAARTGTVPLLSKDTGMKEYPVFDKKGIKIECLYNPAIQLGGLISVKSAVKAASGTWRVNGLTHELESEKPNGRWESIIKASYVGN